MQLSAILTIISTLLAAHISALPTEPATIDVGDTTNRGEVGVESRGWKSVCDECTPGKGQCFGGDEGCYECNNQGFYVCQKKNTFCRCKKVKTWW